MRNRIGDWEEFKTCISMICDTTSLRSCAQTLTNEMQNRLSTQNPESRLLANYWNEIAIILDRWNTLCAFDMTQYFEVMFEGVPLRASRAWELAAFYYERASMTTSAEYSTNEARLRREQELTKEAMRTTPQFVATQNETNVMDIPVRETNPREVEPRYYRWNPYDLHCNAVFFAADRSTILKSGVIDFENHRPSESNQI